MKAHISLFFITFQSLYKTCSDKKVYQALSKYFRTWLGITIQLKKHAKIAELIVPHVNSLLWLTKQETSSSNLFSYYMIAMDQHTILRREVQGRTVLPTLQSLKCSLVGIVICLFPNSGASTSSFIVVTNWQFICTPLCETSRSFNKNFFKYFKWEL